MVKGFLPEFLSKELFAIGENPNVIRVAPHPLYNSYLEVYDFVKILKNAINER